MTSHPGSVLITGASTGIGRELAGVFAAHGHDLVLVARSADKLREAASRMEAEHKVRVSVIPQDLSIPGASENVFRETRRLGIETEILVNNAGIGGYGPFEKTGLEKDLTMIRLNMEALTHLTKLFLPDMLARKRGRILNVASTAAFQPGPLMAVYYATKAYVLSFSEALAEELEGTGVSVSVLCPGPTASEFQRSAGIHSDVATFQSDLVMSSGGVAKRAYRGLMKCRRIIIPGFLNNLTPLAARFLPRRTVTWIAKKLQESRHE